MPTGSNNRIFIVVLAAGRASRFGATKQLATLEDTTLVARALDIAAAVSGNSSVLVAGHDWEAVSAACNLDKSFLILNDRFEQGIGASIALAARALRHSADALLYTLADQPRVTPEHLQTLCETWSGVANEIVASAYAGTLGAPVLFGSACFDALSALNGDQGAKSLFGDKRFTVSTVDFEPAAIDIDTPEDLEKL
jgi:CTP:molybdopterin cytidylyltransferase MocA